MYGMRREFFVSVFLVFLCLMMPASASQFDCGPGYVLVKLNKKVEGIDTYECEKLWCWDLEANKAMGKGDKANSGYQSTSGPSELCDAKNNCVECWGARKWCKGEVNGEWAPEYGSYVRSADDLTQQSYQKGSCFAWRADKPTCDKGMSAIKKDGKWVCAFEANQAKTIRASGVRRTGAIRRMK